ncbi:MAG TPA: hypothetical protein VG797_04765, partial [Phycisphaerales bacterium]|nr:hypothetical protein [Phycisphaerales bacterium]
MSKGMKVLRALAGMAALGLGSGAGADTIVVQDSTFLNNLWMLTTYGGPGSSDGQQAATTGNPAPSRGWSVAVTSTSGTVTAFYKMLTPLATIPPTGEVTSIAASFDVLLGGASGPIQMGLAIEQGGVLYLGPTVMNFPPLGQFGPVSFSNLVATDFHRWEATESPNFSAS